MWVRNIINDVVAVFKAIMSYAEITFNAYGSVKKNGIYGTQYVCFYLTISLDS